jgi:glycosyltransferase involved in cell wall biosynthesis
MKILQIAPPWIDTPPSGYGGTEWVISNLTERLVQRGHDVTLFATAYSRTSARLKYVFEKGLESIQAPWNGALPPLVHYHQAFKLAQEEKFDMVHTHLSSGTDIIIFPFISELKVPHVMTIHGHWPFDRYTFMDDYYKKYYGNDIAAISISKSMEKTSLPEGFRSAGIVYNGLDVSTLKFSPKAKASEPYVTWLGRMVPDKGLYEGILAAKRAKIKFIFAGVVSRYNDIEYQYYNSKIKPMIDGEQVQYIGPADLKLKNRLLGGATAFMNPIQWEEPFGMVMVESMACGTPVISFNRGAAPELIVDGKTGFLVNSVREMVDALGKIDQINRKDCRDHVEEHFTNDATYDGYFKIYEQEIQRYKEKHS